MIHLHVHSNHSLLEGTAGIRQLVGRTVECGMGALALTDTEGMYGAIPFYQAARAAGVKPLLGVKFGECVVLARDREGYAQVCALVTALRLGKTTVEALGTDAAPLALDRCWVLSGDRGLVRGLQERGFEPLVAVTHYGDARSRYHAEAMRRFAHRSGLRAVAVNPVYFLDPEHYRIHRVLTAIRRNSTVDRLEAKDLAPRQAWFRSRREMERLYAAWPDTLDNAEWVAEECDIELPLGTPLFPEFPLEAGETPFSRLWQQTFEGLKARYRPLTPAVIDRVRYELEIIHDLGFAPYFLIVGDIVRFARERDIPVMGRGSAANSVVAYALGITRVDPFRYNLYFERFLNRARTDAPDIDLDLCWRRRDEVIDYVYRTYGAEQVAMICTLNTFQARSAVREVAKAHGLTDRQIGAVARLLPHYHAGDLRTAVKHIPECRGIRLDEEPLRSIVAISEFIDGFPRHLSIHAGGLVIAPERLTRWVPLQRSAKGILITQYDMHPIEDLGLIKMDLLGHRSLTVIDDAVKSVRANRGIALDLESVPDGDRLTADLLRQGKTIACFQIESPAMRALLQKVGACDIPTLIQCIALVRPGASGSGMKQHFIDRHHGREAPEYLHPAMEAVLGETYGVMIYQEDVLKVAHAVAGMDLTEADGLRRATSKKRGPRAMAKHMKRFMEKALANGVAEATAQAIWELIANFAAYSYCKAHAATYGEIAYHCAYLKAHYPAEFFAAVLTNRGGFYTPDVYLEEAKRWGIEVRPVDVRRSAYAYSAEDDALRIGFVEVRRLSQHAVQALLDAREAAPFQDLADCCERVRLPHTDAVALFEAGAFDGFGQPRTVQFWQLQPYRNNRKQPPTNNKNLFKMDINKLIPIFPDYSRKKRANLEWQALGMMHLQHPLCYSLASLHRYRLVASTDLQQHRGQIVSLAGWLIAERRLAARNGSGVMKFLTLEDAQGTYEAVLFPETYQTYGSLLTDHAPYVLTGEVQHESGAYALIVQHVTRATSRPQTGTGDVAS